MSCNNQSHDFLKKSKQTNKSVQVVLKSTEHGRFIYEMEKNVVDNQTSILEFNNCINESLVRNY